MESQFSQISSRRLTDQNFVPFFLTQILSAVNDNILKAGFVALVTYYGQGQSALSSAVVMNVLFVVPFLFLSATSGELADKFLHASLIKRVKDFEIGIMLFALLALVSGKIEAYYVTVFLMGVHATVFGPVKYAYLPSQLPPQALIGANAWVVSTTFVAIFLGTFVGGFLVAYEPSQQVGQWLQNALPNPQNHGQASDYRLVICGLILAGLGRVAAQFIPKNQSVNENSRVSWKIWRATWLNVRYTRGNRPLWLSILGIS